MKRQIFIFTFILALLAIAVVAQNPCDSISDVNLKKQCKDALTKGVTTVTKVDPCNTITDAKLKTQCFAAKNQTITVTKPLDPCDSMADAKLKAQCKKLSAEAKKKAATQITPRTYPQSLSWWIWLLIILGLFIVFVGIGLGLFMLINKRKAGGNNE